jgi:hypothetical protein
MKTKRFFIFGLPAVLLALGLVLAGCGDDDDDSSSPPDESAGLSAFAGVYTDGFFTTEAGNGTTLTVTADALAVDDPSTTTISPVTTSVGGTASGNASWVYLNAGGKKIGIAYVAGSVKVIMLGVAKVTSFSNYNDPVPAIEGIEDGTIIGSAEIR